MVWLAQYSNAVYTVSIPYINTQLLTFQGVILMKLGVFSVSMPEYNIEETARILQQLGYDGIEWRVSAPPPEQKPENYTFENRYWTYNKSTLDISNIKDEAVKAKEICDRHNIEIFSLTSYLRPHETDSIEILLDAASAIGCRNVRVFPPNYDEKENYRVLFDRTLCELKCLEGLASKYGVKINLEIHMGNIIPSASAAYRLVSAFDPKCFGVIYDPGNMVHEGYENYKLGLELLGEYLSYVHVKNAVWNKVDTLDNGQEVWMPAWAPLKKGYANISKLVSNLKETGFNGYLSIEDFSNEKGTIKKLKNNLEFLESLI